MMYKIPLDQIKEKIIGSGKLTIKELDDKIKTKITELSGLISEEGAAHIIANELNIKLVQENNNKLKIKDVYAGMRNISTVGKVVRKYDVREFAKGESTGKVCSLVLADETGIIRVVFWNEQVDQLKDVNENDIIKVKNSYARENNNNREIHLGQQGEIEINPEGIKIDNVQEGGSFARKGISELKGGEEEIEIMGTVVQVFDPRFFNVCPECNGKIFQNGEEFSCATHNIVKPKLSYVTNLIIDDGSGTIRTVFWKNQTNHLLGKTEAEMVPFKEDPSTFEDFKTDLLGEQFKLKGRVKNNEMFDRLEFSVQIVERAKPEEEIAKLETVE